MYKLPIKFIIQLGIFFCAISLVGFFLFFSQNQNVSAAPPAGPFEITGHAWSENIGWISFSCKDGGSLGNNICGNGAGQSNYQVQIDSSKNITGFAWSENIGWIQFGGLNGCPSGNCDAQIISDGGTGWEMTGWARALAYTDPQAGGWDGWISLNCINSNTCLGGVGPILSDYRISISSRGVIILAPTSLAWGEMVVGWTDFSPATINNLCPVTTTYSCLDADTEEWITNDIWCSAIPQTKNCGLGELCNSVSGRCEKPIVVNFRAQPTLVRPGGISTISWNVTLVSSCMVKGAGISLSGGAVGSGPTGPLFNETHLILNCDGLDVASTIVKVLPTVQES